MLKEIIFELYVVESKGGCNMHSASAECHRTWGHKPVAQTKIYHNVSSKHRMTHEKLKASI